MTVNYSVKYTGGTNTPFGFKNKYNATDYNNPKSKGDCSENKSEQSLNLY